MVKKLFFCFMTTYLISFNCIAQTENITRAVWANEAIISTYTYSYQNYLSRQKDIAKYFTAEAWMNFSDALSQSGIPGQVKKNNYRVSAVATRPPKMTSIASGQWRAEMPVLVWYENPQYQQKQTLNISITFKTAPANQGVRGYAITSLQSKITAPICQCHENTSNAKTSKQAIHHNANVQNNQAQQ